MIQPLSDQKAFADLLIRANELKHQTDYRAALACYLKAIEWVGESAALLASVAHCHFAVALSQHGTDQDCFNAVAWMEKAIVLEPNSSSLYTDLGEHYWLATLDYERAAQAYRKAIELDPCNVRALVSAAALYSTPEEVVTLDESINWLERAVQLEPDNPNYHFRLGRLYCEAGRQTDAEQEWLKALLCPQPLDPGPIETIKKALSVNDN